MPSFNFFKKKDKDISKLSNKKSVAANSKLEFEVGPPASRTAGANHALLVNNDRSRSIGFLSKECPGFLSRRM